MYKPQANTNRNDSVRLTSGAFGALAPDQDPLGLVTPW